MMDITLGELHAYPEIKSWTLVNLFTNQETIVTEKMLLDAFESDELMRIKSGRSDAWILIENN